MMKSTDTKDELKKNIRRGYHYDAELEKDEIDSVEIHRDKDNITCIIIKTNKYHKAFRVGICDDCNLLKRSAVTIITTKHEVQSEKHCCEKCFDKMMDEKNMIKERDEFLKSTKK